MQFAATYPLAEIRRIQIYHNTKGYTERDLDKTWRRPAAALSSAAPSF